MIDFAFSAMVFGAVMLMHSFGFFSTERTPKESEPRRMWDKNKDAKNTRIGSAAAAARHTKSRCKSGIGGVDHDAGTDFKRASASAAGVVNSSTCPDEPRGAVELLDRENYRPNRTRHRDVDLPKFVHF